MELSGHQPSIRTVSVRLIVGMAWVSEAAFSPPNRNA
jgi:hypothetical protein